MKPDKVREMSSEELTAKERELSEQLFKLRFQKATGRVENPMKMRQVRREIAQIETLINEREGAQTTSGRAASTR